MKDVVVLNTKGFEKFLKNVIENSFELGVSYVEKRAPFTKEEAIKRIQDNVWEGVVGVIIESED